MGYDFMLMTAKAAPSAFPCDYSALECESEGFPWTTLHDELVRRGAQDEGETLLWDLDDRGKVWITGGDDSAHFDMHAEWAPISDLFHWLHTKHSNIVLFDMSAGVYHDPVSFQKFIAENT